MREYDEDEEEPRLGFVGRYPGSVRIGAVIWIASGCLTLLQTASIGLWDLGVAITARVPAADRGHFAPAI